MPTPSSQLLSRTLYGTDGTTSIWDFSFAGGYLDVDHVKAYTTDALGIRTIITVLPDMLVGPFTLRIFPPLPSGLTLTIYRDTPKDLPIVDFTDESGFSEISLDTNAKQAIFVAAEASDAVGETALNDLYAASAAAQAAAATAVAAAAAAAGSASSLGEPVVNVFSGTGVQTVYVLSAEPIGETSLTVAIGGILQQHDTYSLSGTTLTFTTAPVLGTNNIEVVIGTLLDNAAVGPPGPEGPQGPAGPPGADGLGAGTVTSVTTAGPGTSGTDVSFSIANPTTTPVITFNLPTASAANRGALSSADWTAFNAKVSYTPAVPGAIGGTTPAAGTFTTLTATSRIQSSRMDARVGSTTSTATPAINTDNFDIYRITALAVNITSFTMTGTPIAGDSLIVEITGTAARTIAWGSSFEASTVALPTTTVTTAMLTVAFLWNAATSKWRCVGVA